MKNSTSGRQTGNTRRIMIASDDATIVARLTEALENDYHISSVSTAGAVQGALSRDRPDLVLVDPNIYSGELETRIAELAHENSVLRIIVLENQSGRQFDQYNLFKAGAHGFCKDNIPDSLLSRAVRMVCEGEFWIQRKLIAKMINDLAREIPQQQDENEAGDTNLETLTPRELEVARMVRMGGNNKMIARELDISERTVKAHLSAIFRKLDIQNRLHLALYLKK
jgi:DNA-binding NarL/FixJ family response regulator